MWTLLPSPNRKEQSSEPMLQTGICHCNMQFSYMYIYILSVNELADLSYEAYYWEQAHGQLPLLILLWLLLLLSLACPPGPTWDWPHLSKYSHTARARRPPPSAWAPTTVTRPEVKTQAILLHHIDFLFWKIWPRNWHQKPRISLPRSLEMNNPQTYGVMILLIPITGRALPRLPPGPSLTNTVS